MKYFESYVALATLRIGVHFLQSCVWVRVPFTIFRPIVIVDQGLESITLWGSLSLSERNVDVHLQLSLGGIGSRSSQQ